MKKASARSRWLRIAMLLISLALWPYDAVVAQQWTGFGQNTTGGVGQPEFTVTSTANSGAGTLREILNPGGGTTGSPRHDFLYTYGE